MAADEMGTSLHHWMIRDLVKTFQSPTTNPKNAQLLFTSHDPLLLDDTLLRRDQMVFVQKNKAGSSELFSACDFDGLPDDVSLAKQYLSGTLGAVPRIGNLWASLAPKAKSRRRSQVTSSEESSDEFDGHEGD